ncbi:sel1 repeat family protein [Streptomyces sp. SJ1-7]|nr:sel1 repeat family protein [Streptomyces sp. SJ1-7]
MLVPTQAPDAWGVFDYLTDHTDTPVPDTTWLTALQHTTNADQLTTIGIHAHEAAPGIAESSYRRAVEAGHTDALFNLGILLVEAGRGEEAEGFYRRAAEAGDTDAMVNLGNLLKRTGRAREAEVFYQRAEAAGDRRPG